MSVATSRTLSLRPWCLAALLSLACPTAWAAASSAAAPSGTDQAAEGARLLATDLAEGDGGDQPQPPEKPPTDYAGPTRVKQGGFFSANSRYSGLLALGAARDVGSNQWEFAVAVDNGRLVGRNLAVEVHLFSTQHHPVARYTGGPQALLRLPIGPRAALLAGGGLSLFLESQNLSFENKLFARAAVHATARLVVWYVAAGVQYQIVPGYPDGTLKQWSFFVGPGLSGRGQRH